MLLQQTRATGASHWHWDAAGWKVIESLLDPGVTFNLE